MRLTTKGRYAVTAMVDLAEHGNPGPVRLAEIAERQQISLAYLEQLFAKLRRAGLVCGARGPGGGYRLCRSAGDLSIVEVIEAVDDPMACDTEIPDGCCNDKTRPLTCALWEALNGRVRGFLTAVTLADVLAGRFDVGQAPLPVMAMVAGPRPLPRPPD